MKKPFTYFIIHHSHTDIGYTDYQEKIELYHVFYIREAIDILNAAHTTHPEWLGFKWNCESYWCVEKFLAQASEQYRSDFFKYVRSGEIGLSGSYLNLTDLVDEGTLSEIMAQCREQIGSPIRSAMTCDVNGYSWGFADALFENGTTRLLSSTHAHHGYHPLWRRQRAFYWLSPKGNKVLCWSGEHYHLGNELGFAQIPASESILRDGLNAAEPDLFRRAELRIGTYTENLLSGGYEYDFAPVNVSGMKIDNGSPNASIPEFCRKYNEKHGDQICLKMATLDDFFDAVEAADVEIPTYSGDWTDWWADGVGSTPDVVAHARDAGRKLNILRSLDPEHNFSKDLFESARSDLMFYSEHTWGFSSSVSQPWEPMVSGLDKRKALYACRANESASRALDQLTFAWGETPVSLQKDFGFTVINPSGNSIRDVASIHTKGFFGHERFRLLNEATGEEIPYQIGNYARGPVVRPFLTLAPRQVVRLRLEDLPDPSAEGSAQPAAQIDPEHVETPFWKIRTDPQKGILSIFDKSRNAELIRPDSPYPPFSPVYEMTPIDSRGPCKVRRDMGRCRKCAETQRSRGKLKGMNLLENGPLFCTIEHVYELSGCSLCSVVLTIFKCEPRIDVDLRLHKESRWEPENLYLALPFTAGTDEEFWIDKTGAILRPRIDQLPGTCTDFFALQSGMAYCGKGGSVVIATPDAPLIAMGPLETRPTVLCGEKGANNIDEVYAWVMNNFWETNFKASLGGFHQYRYTLLSLKEPDPKKALGSAKDVCLGLIGFASFTKEKPKV